MLDAVLEIRTFILIDKKTSAELDKHKFCSQTIKRSYFLFELCSTAKKVFSCNRASLQ